MKTTQRFERNLKKAELTREGFQEVMREYNLKIREQITRRKTTKNAFIMTCAQQEINQLTAERDEIDALLAGDDA